MRTFGQGDRVFAHAPVEGTWRVFEGPDDVLAMMDDGADGVIALVRDAGATFLAPIFPDLAGVVCTGGTPRSHIGIVSREFQIPCVMACVLDAEPADGSTVQIDCSAEPGIVRG
jgi:signal transduction protein with GAF and PtsI domain